MLATYLKFLVVCLCFSLQSFAQNEIDRIEFLVGTWKMEGKSTYEHWTKDSSALVGESFKVKDGIKYVSETLRIEQIEETIIYTATVMNQNDGKGITFTLNPNVNDKFSFENTEHDFPKKICYTKLTDSEIFVEVLGENDKGFSYKMQRQ